MADTQSAVDKVKGMFTKVVDYAKTNPMIAIIALVIFVVLVMKKSHYHFFIH